MYGSPIHRDGVVTRHPILIATELLAVADAKREAQQIANHDHTKQVRRAEEALLREAAEALQALAIREITRPDAADASLN